MSIMQLVKRKKVKNGFKVIVVLVVIKVVEKTLLQEQQKAGPVDRGISDDRQ